MEGGRAFPDKRLLTGSNRSVHYPRNVQADFRRSVLTGSSRTKRLFDHMNTARLLAGWSICHPTPRDSSVMIVSIVVQVVGTKWH